jgi:hypothetical protein
MAQGIIEGIWFVIDSSVPKMWGKEDAKEVAPWTAPKWILPMQELRVLAKFLFGDRSQIPIIKTKYCSCDVQSDMLGDSSYVLVECPSHVVVVAEYESLLGVEPNSNDVLCIGGSIALYFLDCSFFGEDILLIVREHDYQGHIEYIL